MYSFSDVVSAHVYLLHLEKVDVLQQDSVQMRYASWLASSDYFPRIPYYV